MLMVHATDYNCWQDCSCQVNRKAPSLGIVNRRTCWHLGLSCLYNHINGLGRIRTSHFAGKNKVSFVLVIFGNSEVYRQEIVCCRIQPLQANGTNHISWERKLYWLVYGIHCKPTYDDSFDKVRSLCRCSMFFQCCCVHEVASWQLCDFGSVLRTHLWNFRVYGFDPFFLMHSDVSARFLTPQNPFWLR